MVAGLPDLRRPREFVAIRRAFVACGMKPRFRIVHFAVLPNHLHLLVEAADREALSRGMQAFGLSLWRRLNALWGRRGPILADPYHARELRSPSETRHALCYVLHNGRRHGLTVSGWDVFSSAAELRSWNGYVTALNGPHPGAGVIAPRTWLLRIGWVRAGAIAHDETPGARPRAARRNGGAPAHAQPLRGRAMSSATAAGRSRGTRPAGVHEGRPAQDRSNRLPRNVG